MRHLPDQQARQRREKRGVNLRHCPDRAARQTQRSVVLAGIVFHFCWILLSGYEEKFYQPVTEMVPGNKLEESMIRADSIGIAGEFQPVPF
jgi:hypothetical protein